MMLIKTEKRRGWAFFQLLLCSAMGYKGDKSSKVCRALCNEYRMVGYFIYRTGETMRQKGKE